MIIGNPSRQDVPGPTEEEARLIRTFMQGAVYSWIKERAKQYFAVRNLVGGENYDWSGTPLNALYLRLIREGKSEDDAIKGAAMELGALTKNMLIDDKRTFKRLKPDEDGPWTYAWTGGEP